ncbi:hypothetical protein TeGR_g7775, partial [Tetraparma gracilis]
YPLACVVAGLAKHEAANPPADGGATFSEIWTNVLTCASPFTVPLTPSVPDSAGEAELMSALGFREKAGEDESFDAFLKRTEALVNIAASVLCASSAAARDCGRWLDAFLAGVGGRAPIYACPVLASFLAVARGALGGAREEVAGRVREVLGRADQGVVGKPSHVRLEKLIKDWLGPEGGKMPEGVCEAFYGRDVVAGAGGGGGG